MGRSYFGLCVCFFVHSSSAYIYEVRVVRRTVPSTNEVQYLVGLSDFHDRSQQRVVTEQRLMFEQLLKQSDSGRTRFLVEDLSSPNSDGTLSCANYRVNTRGGFLGGISDVIRRYGYRIDNLEFRYCRVVALGLTAAGGVSKQARALQEAVHLDQFVHETNKQLKMVAAYQDQLILPWYRSSIRAVEEALARITVHGAKKQTVHDYITTAVAQGKRQDTVLEELLSYDSPLFDVRLVHELYNDTRHKTLIVVAGGTHIRESFNALEKIGYERVPVIQECLISAVNESRIALDLQRQPQSVRLPRPVALSCSKRFWPTKR